MSELVRSSKKPFVIVGTTQADYITDGTADDVEINAALASLGSTGGSVYVKPGTYISTASISIPSNVSLIGSGFSTVLKYASGSGYNGLIKNSVQTDGGAGNTGILIRDLKIDGNSANAVGSDPRDMLFFRNVTNCTVQNVLITDCVDSAFVLDETASNDSTDNKFIDCIADTTGDIGFYFSNTSRNTIQRCIALNTSSYGFRVRRTSGTGLNNQLIGCRAYNCGQNAAFNVDGFMIDTCDLTQLVGCKSILSGRYGFQISDSAYCTLSGCDAYLSDLHGIYLTGAGRGSITGGVVHQSGQTTTNTYSGLYLADAIDWTITGVRSGDSGAGTRQKYGIEENGTSDNNAISSNMLDRNGTGGLLTVGANTIYGLNRV